MVQVPVPQRAYTAAKAVAATCTTVASVATLFVTDVADGSLSWDEGGTLIGAIVAAGATIYAVWRTPNSPKPLQ